MTNPPQLTPKRERDLENHYKGLNRKLRKATRRLSRKNFRKIVNSEIMPIKIEQVLHQINETEELLKLYGFTDEKLEELKDAEESEYFKTRYVMLRAKITDLFDRFDTIERLGLLIGFSGLGFVMIGVLVVYREETIDKAIMNVIHDFYANLGAGAFGTALTVLLLDRIYKNRERQERKAVIISRMTHPDWNLAYEAFGEAVHSKYFTDGSLEEADLSRLNVSNTIFQLAKLSEANFYEAKFSNCQWFHCDFKWGSFTNTKFNQAQLYGCDFRYASFSGADFSGANLHEVRLLNAKLKATTYEVMGISYEGMRAAIFSRETILPNGDRWTPETNMDYFTDPDFPGGPWQPTKWE